MKITIYRKGGGFLPSGKYQGAVTAPEKFYTSRLNRFGGFAHTSTEVEVRIGSASYTGAIWRSGGTPDLERSVVIDSPYEGEITLLNEAADLPYKLLRIGSQVNPCGRFATLAEAEEAQRDIIEQMTGKNWTSRFEIWRGAEVLSVTRRTE